MLLNIQWIRLAGRVLNTLSCKRLRPHLAAGEKNVQKNADFLNAGLGNASIVITHYSLVSQSLLFVERHFSEWRFSFVVIRGLFTAKFRFVIKRRFFRFDFERDPYVCV